MAKLCSGFTHCNNLGHVQSTRTRALGRHVARASAGTSYRDLSTSVDYRRVLGVGPEASKREVKAAYRKLALQFHPDVCRDDETEVDFMEVNKAYKSLMALSSLGDQSQKCNGYEAADSASPAHEDDDPWADFLQSLVNGYREEPREDYSSYYSNLKYYSKAGRSKGYTGSSQYYQGNW
jgi:curved DNA-binding protein CbpA